MSGFRPYKRRRPGTVHDVITRAFDQAGGLDAAADMIGRDPKWCHAASDPDVERRRAASLSYEEARTMSRSGEVTVFAEDLALLAGGVFLPPIPAAAPAQLQQALASYTAESGEAVSEIIRRISDGVFDQADARAALPEIDDALRALLALRTFAAKAAE